MTDVSVLFVDKGTGAILRLIVIRSFYDVVHLGFNLIVSRIRGDAFKRNAEQFCTVILFFLLNHARTACSSVIGKVYFRPSWSGVVVSQGKLRRKMEKWRV